VAVLPLSTWGAFFAAHPRDSIDPFFAEVRPAAAAERASRPDEPAIADRLRALPPPARRRAMLDHLSQQLAAVLGSDSMRPIATDTPLQDIGLDSLSSVELRNRLVKSLGVRLPATLALDYPTLDGMGEFILSRHFPIAPDAVQPSDDAVEIAALSDAEAEAMLLLELERADV
jgi:acyl carrier protein